MKPVGDAGEGGGSSARAGSGEKSARSSRVKTGGGGGSEEEKFSRQRAETAAAWPGVAKRPPRWWEEIGEARSRKKGDSRAGFELRGNGEALISDAPFLL